VLFLHGVFVIADPSIPSFARRRLPSRNEDLGDEKEGGGGQESGAREISGGGEVGRSSALHDSQDNRDDKKEGGKGVDARDSGLEGRGQSNVIGKNGGKDVVLDDDDIVLETEETERSQVLAQMPSLEDSASVSFDPLQTSNRSSNQEEDEEEQRRVGANGGAGDASTLVKDGRGRGRSGEIASPTDSGEGEGDAQGEGGYADDDFEEYKDRTVEEEEVESLEESLEEEEMSVGGANVRAIEPIVGYDLL